MTVVRVTRGQPHPSEQDFQAAIERDRVRLHQAPHNSLRDLAIAGPYPVTVDGQQFDEYVVWEQ